MPEISTFSVKPIIHYPRVLQVGKSYLMEIDVQSDEDFTWSFEEEDYPIYCVIDSEPFFETISIGEPAVVLHCHGNSYGPASFLLKAKQLHAKGKLKVRLINKWGLLIKSIDLSDLKVLEREDLKIESFGREEGKVDDYIPPALHQSSGDGSLEEFTIRFWGVRADIPCPGPQTIRYGGNTPCVEMRVNNKLLIFEAGTGLRVLGQEILSEMPLEAYLFLSHTHWESIQGFPFFTPGFVPGNRLHIYGIPSPAGLTVEQRLSDQMLHPNHPVPLQIMGSEISFHDLEVGQSVEIGNDVLVENALINHPGEAVGYRITCNDMTVAFVNNTEQFPGRLDDNVLQLSHKANVLVYDARFTDEEYFDEHAEGRSRIGMGNSTWQEGVKIARAAEVKQLILFNHDPQHSDTFLDEISRKAAEAFPNSIVAQEGMLIDVAAISKFTS